MRATVQHSKIRLAEDCMTRVIAHEALGASARLRYPQAILGMYFAIEDSSDSELQADRYALSRAKRLRWQLPTFSCFW